MRRLLAALLLALIPALIGSAPTLSMRAALPRTSIQMMNARVGWGEVSPRTVSAAFGSKRGILAAIVNPDAFGHRLQEVDDPSQRVRLAAQLTRRAYEGLTAEFDVLRGASAATSPSFRAAAEVRSARCIIGAARFGTAASVPLRS